ncbi:hypothetical protein BJ138DRAFT_1118773 [Hygrophoropsis aurantiaca]|uniref:Uncharacterized protein n=1 Tax=Hygrophoropsis aurantiaca TaxID=72124 RepID=A0ACB7ZVB8_9AGAM|nr:hypothetical protein BJ138DRAFT_1118773 [Hygrophoropsis aurantiaca]
MVRSKQGKKTPKFSMNKKMCEEPGCRWPYMPKAQVHGHAASYHCLQRSITWNGKKHDCTRDKTTGLFPCPCGDPAHARYDWQLVRNRFRNEAEGHQTDPNMYLDLQPQIDPCDSDEDLPKPGSSNPTLGLDHPSTSSVHYMDIEIEYSMDVYDNPSDDMISKCIEEHQRREELLLSPTSTFVLDVFTFPSVLIVSPAPAPVPVVASTSAPPVHPPEHNSLESSLYSRYGITPIDPISLNNIMTPMPQGARMDLARVKKATAEVEAYRDTVALVNQIHFDLYPVDLGDVHGYRLHPQNAQYHRDWYLLVPSASSALHIIRSGWGPSQEHVVDLAVRAGITIRTLAVDRCPIPPAFRTPPSDPIVARTGNIDWAAEYNNYKIPMLAGGILWCICKDFVLLEEPPIAWSDLVKGPSEGVIRNGRSLRTPFGTHWEDYLSDEEINVVIGMLPICKADNPQQIQ